MKGRETEDMMTEAESLRRTVEQLDKTRLLGSLYGFHMEKPPPIPMGNGYSPSERLNPLMTTVAASYGALSEVLGEYPSLPVSWKEMKKKLKKKEKADDENTVILNPPAVETVNWEAIKSYVPADRWKVIQCVLSWERFQQEVIKNPTELPSRIEENTQNEQRRKNPPLPAKIVEQIVNLCYVKEPRAPTKFTEPLFCVPRPDGKLRLIWDGRDLNRLCHTPPQFHLRSIGEHLAVLLSPKIKLLIVWDMKSWFVQLRPEESVATMFGVILGGRRYVLCGLPMGWSWAPVIAQFSAEGVANRIICHIPVDIRLGIVTLVYIDNMIMGLDDEASARVEDIVSTIQEQTSKMGAVIKPGSLMVGTRAEWLGTEVDVRGHQFRLKATFVKKMTDCAKIMLVEPTQTFTIRCWYSLISSLIFALWTRQRELCEISKIIRWMADLSAMIKRPADWDQVVVAPQDILQQIREKISPTLHNPWTIMPTWKRDLPARGVGTSDASSSALAWAFHSPTSMTLAIQKNEEPEQAIFFAEQRAIHLGCRELAEELPKKSAAKWKADNTGAIYVSRKGLSKFESVNEDLRVLFQKKREVGLRFHFDYVPSEKNLVDKASRMNTAGKWKERACEEHPGAWCKHFESFISRITSEVSKKGL